MTELDQETKQRIFENFDRTKTNSRLGYKCYLLGHLYDLLILFQTVLAIDKEIEMHLAFKHPLF